MIAPDAGPPMRLQVMLFGMCVSKHDQIEALVITVQVVAARATRVD